MGIVGMRTRRAFTDDGIGLTGTGDSSERRKDDICNQLICEVRYWGNGTEACFEQFDWQVELTDEEPFKPIIASKELQTPERFDARHTSAWTPPEPPPEPPKTLARRNYDREIKRVRRLMDDEGRD